MDWLHWIGWWRRCPDPDPVQTASRQHCVDSQRKIEFIFFRLSSVEWIDIDSIQPNRTHTNTAQRPGAKNAILIRFVFSVEKRIRSVTIQFEQIAIALPLKFGIAWQVDWNDECTYATYHGRFRVCEIRFNETKNVLAFSLSQSKVQRKPPLNEGGEVKMKIRSFCSRLIRCRYVPECPLMTYNLCN